MTLDRQTAEAAVEQHGGQSAAARALGVTRSALRYGLGILNAPCRARFETRPELAGGNMTEPEEREGGGVYILCAAQGGAALHGELWRNILAYAEERDAEILVGRSIYDTRESKNTAEPDTECDPYAWDARLEPHIVTEPVRLAETLEFSAHMNILPTAKSPLSGVTTPPLVSSVLPHQKRAMVSIPSTRGRPVIRYTTGSITVPRHIKRKAGILAEFHHSYGFAVAEIADDGRWWVRHVPACDDGEFQDLNWYAKHGLVTDGAIIDHMVMGDIHYSERDEDVYEASVGEREDSISKVLQPQAIVLHDWWSGESVNRHESFGDRFRRKAKDCSPTATVTDDLVELGYSVQGLLRENPQVTFIVPDANHHSWLQRWLDTADYRTMGQDALLFLELELNRLNRFADDADFNYLEEALTLLCGKPARFRFLARGESYKRCGIELCEHGDLSPNGMRGGAGLARTAEKLSVGHSHSASITEGLYVAGTTSKLDMKYNRGGGSSWSHSHIIAYPTGSRAILTFWGPDWRAPDTTRTAGEEK